MSASADMALPGAEIRSAEAEHRRLRQRETWRRRILPCLGILIGIGAWEAIVVFLKVPPFIAPTPLVVVSTFVSKFDLLMSNLWLTVVEALCGFLIGNLFAVTLATLFVHRRAVSETFFPVSYTHLTLPTILRV